MGGVFVDLCKSLPLGVACSLTARWAGGAFPPGTDGSARAGALVHAGRRLCSGARAETCAADDGSGGLRRSGAHRLPLVPALAAVQLRAAPCAPGPGQPPQPQVRRALRLIRRFSGAWGGLLLLGVSCAPIWVALPRLWVARSIPCHQLLLQVLRDQPREPSGHVLSWMEMGKGTESGKAQIPGQPKVGTRWVDLCFFEMP